MKKSKEKRKINYFILIFRIISIIIIAVCLYVLYLWDQDNRANDSLQKDLSSIYADSTPIDSSNNSANNTTPFASKYTLVIDENGLNIELFNIDFESLKNQNPDSVAWVRVLDTNISYPILQTDNNDYYLTHNIEGKKNGAGWIFADYRNNFENLDKNTIIYGHNRRNGTMFSNLKFYLDKDFCADENHKYINFNTQKQRYLAEVFSVYKTASNKVELPNEFESAEDFLKTIEMWKSASIYDFQTEVTSVDNVLSLYTCDNNTAYRILIHAKLLPLDV